MKDAPAEHTGTTTGPAELPTNPPNGRTAGVDWAKDDHVVAVVDSTGTAIDRFTVPHTGTGLAELTRHLAQAGCAEVAIERPDGPVPDSPATVTLRGTCRARKDLVGHRVALANQLRAHLQTALPAADLRPPGVDALGESTRHGPS
jgi:Transposase